MSGAIAGAVIAGSLGAAGSIASGVMGSSAAGHAADAQVQAAQIGAQTQQNIANQNIAQQNRVIQEQMQLLSPFYQTGQGAMANLASLMGVLPAGVMAVNPMTVAGQVAAQGVTPQNPTASGPTRVPPVVGAGRPPGSGEQMPMVGANGQPINTNLSSGAISGRFGGVPAGVTPAQTAGMGQTLNSLVNPALGASGSLYQELAKPFVAPDNVTEQNDPGYQFRLKQGLNALDMGAAAKGGLLTGGTAKAENMFGQDYASNEYGNVYNRAVNNYQLGRQSALDRYNTLSAMMGGGQIASGQGVGAVGQYGNNLSNIYSLLGSQLGQAANNAGAARASGYIGGANALSAGIGGATNSLSQMMMLQQLLNQQNQGGSGAINMIANAGY